MNPTVVDAQGIHSNRFSGRFALHTAIPNIEGGAVQGTNQAIGSQSPALELRQRMRALVLDREELALGVTDQNVLAGYLKGLATAFGNIHDIGQILKHTVVHRDDNRSIGIPWLAQFFVPSDAVILFAKITK